MAEFVAANGYRQCRERGHHTRWKPRALLLVVVVLAMAVKVAAAAQAAHLLAQEKSCTSSARGIGRRWRRGRRRRAPTFEAKDQACIVLWHQCISPLPSPFPSPNCKVAARGPLWGEQLLRNLGKGRGGVGGSASWPKCPSPIGLKSTPQESCPKVKYDPGRTQTCNLWFRRPTPYPLGHRAS